MLGLWPSICLTDGKLSSILDTTDSKFFLPWGGDDLLLIFVAVPFGLTFSNPTSVEVELSF